MTPRIDADGQTRIYEKDVTLDIAQRLNAYLRGRGFPTVMTRTHRPGRRGCAVHHRRRRPAGARRHRQQRRGQALRVDPRERPQRHGVRHRDLPLLLLQPGRPRPRRARPPAGARGPRPARPGRQDGGLLRPQEHPHARDPRRGRVPHQPDEALLLADPAVRQRLAEAIGVGVAKYTAAGYDALYGQQQSLKPRYQVNAGAFRKLADARARYRLVRRTRLRGGDPQRVQRAEPASTSSTWSPGSSSTSRTHAACGIACAGSVSRPTSGPSRSARGPSRPSPRGSGPGGPSGGSV